MLNYSVFIDSSTILEKFKKSSKIAGAIFLLLGILGILFPEFISLTSAIFFGWLLLFSGFMVGYQLWQTNAKDWLGWLKFALLTLTGILIVLNPITGVISLGLLFVIYFFIDGFASVSLAFGIRPKPMWWLSLLNGILSIVLGIAFLMAIENPIQALKMVGILIGISLFFDGFVLLSLSNTLETQTSDQNNQKTQES